MLLDKTLDVIVSGGVEIRGLKVSAIPRRKPAWEPVLEEYKFVANDNGAEVTLCEIVRISTHISMENHLGIKIKIIELIEEVDKVPAEEILSPLILESLGDLPLIQADVNIIGHKSSSDENFFTSNISIIDKKNIGSDTNALLAVGYKLLTPGRAENLALLTGALKEGGFILTREDISQVQGLQEYAQSKGLNVILQKKSGSTSYFLLRKRVKTPKRTVLIYISNNEFDWVDKMRKTMTQELEKGNVNTSRIIYVSEGDFENGMYLLLTNKLSNTVCR